MKASVQRLTECVALLTALTASTSYAAAPPWAAAKSALLSAPGQTTSESSGDNRKESDRLIAEARKAMAKNDWKAADDNITKAEKLGVNYGMLGRLYDTPAKARKDLDAAKSKANLKKPSSRFDANSNVGTSAKKGAPLLEAVKTESKDAAIEKLTDDSKGFAVAALASARTALKAGRMTEAIAQFQKARSYNATFSEEEDSPEKLAADLEKAGADIANLPKEAASPFRLSPSDLDSEIAGKAEIPVRRSFAEMRKSLGATESETPAEADDRVSLPSNKTDFVERLPSSKKSESPKAKAQRLVAEAGLAKDKGDLQKAFELASEAQNLKVSDSEFAANESRPWQLVVEIQKQAQRRGVSLKTGRSQVAPAAYNETEEGGQVAQGVYRPQRDASKVAPASAQSGAGGADQGARLYDEGLNALENQDRETALSKFSEAWQFEKDLDVRTRQSLKDKLQMLRAANATANREPQPLSNVTDDEALLYQKMVREVAAERKAVEKLAETEPKKALENLKQLRDRVGGAQLDPVGKKQLLTIIDRSSKELASYIEQNKAQIELDEQNARVQAERTQEAVVELEIQGKLKDISNRFNKAIDERDFGAAEALAAQARELAPNSSIAEMLSQKSQLARNIVVGEQIEKEKQQGFVRAMESVDESSAPFDDRESIKFNPKYWNEMSKRRSRFEREGSERTPAEMEIEAALNRTVDVKFVNRPLAEVIETLSQVCGVNIYLDNQALVAEALQSSTPVTLNLSNPIKLKSALNIMLNDLKLVATIQNDVLMITSKEAARGASVVKTYYVADLVTPIPNFVPSYNIGLAGAIRESFNALGYTGPGRGQAGPNGSIPLTMGPQNANAQNSFLGQAAPVLTNRMPEGSLADTSRATMNAGIGPGGIGSGVNYDSDTLIDLVYSTIQPDSWRENGGAGQGTAEFVPQNLSLVISNTQEVHQQIADLLRQLRSLQDLQVTIEVRFITITDNFFERIGVDFDFRIDDNSGFPNPAAIPQQFDDGGRTLTIGLQPPLNGSGFAAPTDNLDFQFTQGGFNSAIPAFGGFDAGTAANFGFAILSDIEVFLVIQAAQGDSRTNVLQAPKVTLFNGQTGFINDTTQRPFVTTIIPVVGDFAAAYQPVITVLSEGTSLGVQPVVSKDRRFVRLTLVPVFSHVGDVSTFTFTGSTTSNSGTTVQDPTNPGKTVRQGAITTTGGTTVQLPSLASTSVSTTVSVPDGGTVLLGGIKRLSEGRVERGVPFLSKLPYVSRLFKNVGIGRTASSLMLMVTPRIIIQEEEEERLGL